MATGSDTRDLLGLGIYTPSEAARYARVETARMTRWIIGTSHNRPAVRAQIDPAKNDEKWITFLDFVQAMAIRDIRDTKKIPLERIRETIEMAHSKFNIDYPFARKHTTYLLGEHIKLEIEGYGLIDATGPHKNQLNLKVMESYLEDLSYDAEGLAKQYVPYVWKGHSIVLDPSRRFGEPFVRPGRYSVNALCDAYEAEGSDRAAARALGVKEEAVEAARRYLYDYLRTKQAA
jgi:uncharacterized protein (DUF433 family)